MQARREHTGLRVGTRKSCAAAGDVADDGEPRGSCSTRRGDVQARPHGRRARRDWRGEVVGARRNTTSLFDSQGELPVVVVVKTFIEQRERVKPVSSMKLGVILSPGRHWSKPPLEPVGPELVVSLVRSC